MNERLSNSWGVPLPTDLRSGPVVVGVDATETCGRPIRAATFLARCLERPVLLVHVRRRLMPLAEGYLPVGEDLQLTGEVEKELDEKLAAGLAAGGDLEGVEWQLLSSYGEAAAELIRIAIERDAAVVVVGKRHSGFAEVVHRIASGSVSRAMVSAQKFPVMVVP
jgi:nucleotide-binding universal stress UspA family protein